MPLTLQPSYGYQYEPLTPKTPQREPERGVDPNRERKPQDPMAVKSRFGIHLWQIFTAMTLILTVASSLIYFNSIIPQNKNADFISSTKAKTTLYNEMEYLKSYYDTNYNKNLVGYELSGACYSDISKVDETSEGLEKNLGELDNQQKRIDAIRAEYENKRIKADYSDSLKLYMDDVQSYLTSITLIFQKQQIYKKQTVIIQKQAAAVCSSELSKTNEELKTFDRAVDSFPLDSLETMKPWVQKAKDWSEVTKQIIQEINKDDYDPTKIQDLKNSLRTGYIDIFSTAFDYDTYKAPIESAYSSSLDHLRKVEEFESNYIAKNKLIAGNTVFVTFKKD